jgi:hypothetical protein
MQCLRRVPRIPEQKTTADHDWFPQPVTRQRICVHPRLFIGAMGLTHLGRYTFRGDTLVREERIFDGMPWRVRAVSQGPGGLLYLGVDTGMLLRLRPGDPAPLRENRKESGRE